MRVTSIWVGSPSLCSPMDESILRFPAGKCCWKAACKTKERDKQQLKEHYNVYLTSIASKDSKWAEKELWKKENCSNLFTYNEFNTNYFRANSTRLFSMYFTRNNTDTTKKNACSLLHEENIGNEKITCHPYSITKTSEKKVIGSDWIWSKRSLIFSWFEAIAMLHTS